MMAANSVGAVARPFAVLLSPNAVQVVHLLPAHHVPSNPLYAHCRYSLSAIDHDPGTVVSSLPTDSQRLTEEGDFVVLRQRFFNLSPGHHFRFASFMECDEKSIAITGESVPLRIPLCGEECDVASDQGMNVLGYLTNLNIHVKSSSSLLFVYLF